MVITEFDNQGAPNLVDLQGWATKLVNFVPALAYHFCLNLPEKFSKPGIGNLAQPYSENRMLVTHYFINQ